MDENGVNNRVCARNRVASMKRDNIVVPYRKRWNLNNSGASIGHLQFLYHSPRFVNLNSDIAWFIAVGESSYAKRRR